MRGLDLKSRSDTAICKVVPRANGLCHQPLTIVQPSIRGMGMAVGSTVTALGYATMQSAELAINAQGELIDDNQLRFDLHVSNGVIKKILP